MSRMIFKYYPEPFDEENKELEKKIFKLSLIIPSLFVFALLFIRFAEDFLGVELTHLGVYPRAIKGLIGILTGPFIHADWKHAIGNAGSFFVLASSLFYFYRKQALKIFTINYFVTGILLWAIGRDAWHIGASGVIYGLAAFLFLSGILRNDLRLLVIALIVTFLYGSMFWGLFPIEEKISWEGHLSGTISGILLALIFIKHGPPRRKFEWEEEEEEEETEEKENEKELTELDIKKE